MTADEKIAAWKEVECLRQRAISGASDVVEMYRRDWKDAAAELEAAATELEKDSEPHAENDDLTIVKFDAFSKLTDALERAKRARLALEIRGQEP